MFIKTNPDYKGKFFADGKLVKVEGGKFVSYYCGTKELAEKLVKALNNPEVEAIKTIKEKSGIVEIVFSFEAKYVEEVITKERMEALANAVGAEFLDDIDQIDEEDNLFGLYGGEYKVLTEDEAYQAVTDDIKESLWAFNASFLANITNLPEEVFKALSNQFENSNEAILKLVETTCGLETLVAEAIKADGYGHFLAPYDSDEQEYTLNDTTYYIYRTN